MEMKFSGKHDRVAALEYKLNAVTETIQGLSRLHDPKPYLGLDYCHSCSREWPCESAEVYQTFYQLLGRG